MLLYEFLNLNQEEIIQLCRKKVAADSDSKPTSPLLNEGLPIFYRELIGVLERTAAAGGHNKKRYDDLQNTIKEGDAATHGKESLRLGYTISQVVHSYGALCQSIMECLVSKRFEITPGEFQDLNFSLDCAIAEAVTEFEKTRSNTANNNEIERLGFLLHEMRNSLAAASAAHQVIRKGTVGGAGITSEVLSRSHDRMLHLIENTETEIRFRGDAPVELSQIKLMEIVNEVYESAIVTGNLKEIHFKLTVDPLVQFTAERRLVFTAISNLVNNAMKFTSAQGCVSIRGKESKGRILIEVEDECGGLEGGTTEELFNPFTQKGLDKTGMGLGLSLSRRAVEANQGKLTVRNIAGKGCVFLIDLPVRPL